MYVTLASIKKKIVTIILAVLNIGVYLLVNVYLNSKTGRYWLDNLAQQRDLIIRFGQYYRIFSAMWVHADLTHLLSNMLFLVIFGLLVENRYSIFQYLIIYFVSGLLGNLVSLISLPPTVLSLGASGCIFGLMGAYYISFISYDKKFILYAIISSMIMVGFSIGTNVNSWAHLFGAIGGLLLGWIFTQYNKRKLPRLQNPDVDKEKSEIEDY